MTADPAAPLDLAQIEHLYRTLIHPVLFGSSPGRESNPTLVLLGGQPGAGKSQAGARLITEHDGMVAVTGDDLRIFHPLYRELTTDQPERAPAFFAATTREWVRATIQSSLEERRSLLLEGTFGDPDITLATADRFRQAGFRVRVVAVASPRVVSIVTIASRYLRDRKLGNPARFTRLSAHDRGYDGTGRLIAALDASPGVDRVTILSRSGTILFDQSRGKDEADVFGGARSALATGRDPESWGARSTMELLGELKQITAYAIAAGEMTPQTAELLIEAHNLALVDVTPRLSIDTDSPQARFIHQAITEQLVALRRAAASLESAPPVAVVETARDPSGPTLS
jgi:UDP-N-acetylglucosamine kinase